MILFDGNEFSYFGDCPINETFNKRICPKNGTYF